MKDEAANCVFVSERSLMCVSGTEAEGDPPPVPQSAHRKLTHPQRDQEIPPVKGQDFNDSVCLKHFDPCASSVCFQRVCVCVLQVLPPLRDVTNRPEVGDALRNKLVRLMTHVDTDVKDAAAEFLFVLCKENGQLWPRRCGPAGVAPPLWSRRCGPAGVVPPVWSRRYGPAGVALLVWPFWLHTSAVLLLFLLSFCIGVPSPAGCSVSSV